MSGESEDKAALRSALVHAVGSICEAECGEKGLPLEASAVCTLVFVLEQYAKVLAVDLSAFAKHGKRSAISVEDVLLCARRNPDLLKRLTAFVETNDLTKAKAPKKKKIEAPPAAFQAAADFDDAFFDDDNFASGSTTKLGDKSSSSNKENDGDAFF